MYALTLVDGEKGTRLAVEDAWLRGEIMNSATCCYGWAWRDELTLAAVFNTGFHVENFTTQFMLKVKRNAIGTRTLNVHEVLFGG